MSTIDSRKILNEVINDTKHWKKTGIFDLERMPVWRIYQYRLPDMPQQLYKLTYSAVEEAAMHRDLGNLVADLIFECPAAERCFHCSSFVTEPSRSSKCPIRRRHGTGDRITVEIRRP